MRRLLVESDTPVFPVIAPQLVVITVVLLFLARIRLIGREVLTMFPMDVIQ